MAASDKAYGRHERLPYTEDAALAPRYPYDVSKAAADLIARSYWHTFGLPVAVTRLANVYGGGDLHRVAADPGGDRGGAARPRAGAALRRLARARPPVRRGRRQRLPGVHEAVLDGRPGARGEAFNAGSGAPHRVGDVVTLICRLAGSPTLTPEIRGPAVPPAEIDRQWLDSREARRR